MYFVDDAVASPSYFFGDFVVVGGKVAEVGFDFVVFVGLADFGFLAVVGVGFLFFFFLGHV